jgi:peptidyl-prolyl cis-trans isomerase B (cyclophilin B)
VSRPHTAVLAALVLAAAGCGGDDDGGRPAGGGDAGSASRSGGCQDVKAPKPKPDRGRRKPSGRLDPSKTYRATIRTSCGDIVIRLDVKDSPRTTASFVSLARSGFYDRTSFHRIVPGFVIQGGDPTGTGTGGPGYTTRDVPPRDAVYSAGVVAMAKTATEPPGTAGSQFYIVTAPDAGLPPEYALLGKVVKGRAVADRIGRQGDPNSGDQGTPLKPVVLDEVTIDAS